MPVGEDHLTSLFFEGDELCRECARRHGVLCRGADVSGSAPLSVVGGHIIPNEGDPQLLDVFAIAPLRQEEEWYGPGSLVGAPAFLLPPGRFAHPLEGLLHSPPGL